jgi:hypothetical protein
MNQFFFIKGQKGMRFGWVLFIMGSLLVHTANAQSKDPLKIIDLASDTDWTLSIDGGNPRAVRVPGGGYNSDKQDQPWIEMSVEKGERDVKNYVTYERLITIPKVQKGQVTLVEFGAVNHGAEVYLVDGRKETLITAHVGPLMPFSADLTDVVTPGKTYKIIIKAHPLWYYKNEVPVGFIYTEGWKNPKHGWASKFGFGITKYVRLAIYPQVRISNVFIQPSVSKNELKCAVWVQNHDRKSRTVIISGKLSSWNNDKWKYPILPDKTVTIPGNSTIKIAFDPVRWNLGPTSYWWPNKPFREDYKSKLHNLQFSLNEGKKSLSKITKRFGFVEWTEGPFYYKVNGVRINFISDGTPESAMSEYDCYSTSAAFLPPTASGTGCPETWKRYMRMGVCANRIHQSTPTDYMMDVADELGFMLIPETAIRGCQNQQWHSEYLPQAVKELAMICRNHPSVSLYGLQNEATPAWAGPLADAIVTVDPTRPLIFDDNQQKKPGRITGDSGAHAYAMNHYVDYPDPAQMISGMGEFAWQWTEHGKDASPLANGELEDFSYFGCQMRMADIAYFAGWDFLNYWPNFLQGMNYKKHVWKQSANKDRTDGVDGWNSPIIRWVQKSFDPYLVVDTAFLKSNGKFEKGWPKRIPVYKSSETVKRNLEIFNDGLFGDKLNVRWSTRWDSAEGPLVANGEIADIIVKPGFHALKTISFITPSVQSSRTLFLVLESVMNGKVLFIDKQVRFNIIPFEKKS